MRYLHLDSEYRDRWEEFFLTDGTVEDSRLKNWRQVAWEQVVQITVHIVGHVHTVNCKDPRFKAFMNFRWGGFGFMLDDSGKQKDKREPINIWTIGWTDGITCFLKDIDALTGKLIKNYEVLLIQFKGHIHPNVRETSFRRIIYYGLCKSG
jgi:hypothetical protein